MFLTADKFAGFVTKGSTTNPLGDAESVILSIINWILVAIFIASFVYLVLAGVKYITSGGDTAKATEARTAIIHAIIGMVVVTLALFIVQAAVDFGTTLGA